MPRPEGALDISGATVTTSDDDQIRGNIPVHWTAGYRLELPPGAPPPGGFPILLALHGFGEDGDTMAERLGPREGATCARLLPDGPFPVELREGERRRIGRAWYQYDGDQETFLRALTWGQDHLRRLLEAVAERHPVDPRRVVLLGFSQGGYLASAAALRERDRYRGLVAVACRIKTEILSDELAAARGYPVLVVHGARDRATPCAMQEEAVRVLAGAGLEVEVELHPRGHRLPPESVPRIHTFVDAVLNDAAPSRGGA